MPSISKNMEQQELSSIAREILKWYNHLGQDFGSFFNVKCILILISTMALLNIYPKKI